MDGQKILPRTELPFSLERINFHSGSVDHNARYLCDFYPCMFPIICPLDCGGEGRSDKMVTSLGGSVRRLGDSGELSSSRLCLSPACSYFETNPPVCWDPSPVAPMLLWHRGDSLKFMVTGGEADTSHFLFKVRILVFLFLFCPCGKEERVQAEGSDYRFEWS